MCYLQYKALNKTKRVGLLIQRHGRVTAWTLATSGGNTFDAM